MNKNNNRIINVLNNYLEDAEKYYGEYPLENEDIKKEKIIKNFMNEIMSYLDHTLTCFPVENYKVKHLYFPRDNLNQSENQFITDLKNKNYPKKIYKYLKFCYGVNKKHSSALYYVTGSHKHRDTIELKDQKSHRFKANISGYSKQNPIITDNEFLNINNFIKVPKTTNFKMNQVRIITPESNMMIHNLESGPIIIKGKKNILKGYELDIIDWGKNCLILLHKIHEYYKNHVLQLK